MAYFFPLSLELDGEKTAVWPHFRPFWQPGHDAQTQNPVTLSTVEAARRKKREARRRQALSTFQGPSPLPSVDSVLLESHDASLPLFPLPPFSLAPFSGA